MYIQKPAFSVIVLLPLCNLLTVFVLKRWTARGSVNCVKVNIYVWLILLTKVIYFQILLAVPCRIFCFSEMEDSLSIGETIFFEIFKFFSYYIQHSFTCRPSDSTVPRMLGWNPGLLHLVHRQSDALTTRLDLILFLKRNNQMSSAMHMQVYSVIAA